MTGTTVNGLNSLMTFVGTVSKPSASSRGADFESLMAKAGGNQTKTDIGSAEPDTGKKTDSKNFISKMNESKRNEVKNVKDDNHVADSKNDIKDETEIQEGIDEAGKKLVSEIAKELNVDEEEVTKAMEVLGISAIDLLNPDNIGKLVLELNGESDPIALATDESIFNTVKELTTIVDATLGDLAEDMDMEVPELKEEISKMLDMNASLGKEMEMSVNADSEPLNDTVKETPQITISVEQNGHRAEIETDENGNEIKTVSVFKEETAVQNETENSGKSDGSKNEHKSEEQKGGLEFQQGIQSHQSQVDNITNFNEISEVQDFASPDTERIMDQILEHIKVNAKPDVQELELSLHPASLGNVKVNLTSKAGEVTAEFKVQNELVKAAVEAQLQELRETFKAQGTKVTAIEVSVEMQSFDSNLWQGKGQDNEAGNGDGSKRRPRRIDLNTLDDQFTEEATEEEVLAAKMMEANGNTVDYMA